MKQQTLFLIVMMAMSGNLHAQTKSPVAFGTINGNGTIMSGSGNFTVSHTGATYEIAINGENYSSSKYATVATPILSQDKNGIISTDSRNNHLLVSYKQWYIIDKAIVGHDYYGWSNPLSNMLPDLFSFVVFKQ